MGVTSGSLPSPFVFHHHHPAIHRLCCTLLFIILIKALYLSLPSLVGLIKISARTNSNDKPVPLTHIQDPSRSMHPQLSHHHPTSSQHNYGTRIRKNSVLKPSARLRQCPPSPHPAPRRIKPVPIPAVHHPVSLTPDPCFPIFPLPGVMLHPEDASNKVFHAIGRSFLSVVSYSPHLFALSTAHDTSHVLSFTLISCRRIAQ